MVSIIQSIPWFQELKNQMQKKFSIDLFLKGSKLHLDGEGTWKVQEWIEKTKSWRQKRGRKAKKIKGRIRAIYKWAWRVIGGRHQIFWKNVWIPI